MYLRLLCIPALLVAFVIGCSDREENLIAYDPTPYETTIAFQSFVKNAGVNEVTEPFEISGSATYIFSSTDQQYHEVPLKPSQDLTLRVHARVNRSIKESFVGEVSCQGCEPLTFGDKPSIKLHRTYALPGAGSNVRLTIEFIATRGSVAYSHAWIDYAE